MPDTLPHPAKQSQGARRGAWVFSLWLLPILGLLVWGLLMPLPFHGRLGSALGDMVHAPVFALLGLSCYLALRRLGMRRPTAALSVWLALCAFGLATEVAQSFVGRGDSWEDALNDVLGAAGGICMGLALETASRKVRGRGMALGILLVLMAEFNSLWAAWDYYAQRRAMPLLASFEGWRELDRWSWSGESRMQSVAEHATQGKYSLRVDLSPGRYPGIVLVEPPPDWSAYQELVFDIDVAPAKGGDGANPRDSTPLELIVKIEDWPHKGDFHDRFHRLLHLTPGKHEVRIPLADVAGAPLGRKMDLKQIHLVQLFVPTLAEPRTFYLDNMRLE